MGFPIPWSVMEDLGIHQKKFHTFRKAWNFSNEMSSPGNSQSNGAAEVAVNTAKRLFQKCHASSQDPYIGLLNQRNTPTEGAGASRAQSLMSWGTKNTNSSHAECTQARGRRRLSHLATT
ncbi:hypothetical protein HOLleu_23423 [Holothuria leucospilota]|uniref:Uncharacterized protein n=1 Tax=Holothuria leucospilota TaxID=206669 RepID=A0A9Q1BUZ4_HOLLE|nr:hypothetical protein HOLleu_23423 [Holothuria leucospilota]